MVDSCVCVNPLDADKKGAESEAREIDTLQTSSQRANAWAATSMRHGLNTQWMQRTLSSVDVLPDERARDRRPLPPECNAHLKEQQKAAAPTDETA